MTDPGQGAPGPTEWGASTGVGPWEVEKFGSR